MVPRATPRLWTRVGRLPEAGPARTGRRAFGRSSAQYGSRPATCPLDAEVKIASSPFRFKSVAPSTLPSSRLLRRVLWGRAMLRPQGRASSTLRRTGRRRTLVGAAPCPFLAVRAGGPVRAGLDRTSIGGVGHGRPSVRASSSERGGVPTRPLPIPGPEAHAPSCADARRRPPTAAPAGGLRSCRWGSRPRIHRFPRSPSSHLRGSTGWEVVIASIDFVARTAEHFRRSRLRTTSALLRIATCRLIHAQKFDKKLIHVLRQTTENE